MCVVLLVLVPTSASAFCRKTTVDPDPGFTPTPATPCWTEGVPLFWKEMPVSYSVNEAASVQVSLAVTEDTMALAFAQWSGAMCTPDAKTRLEVVFAGPTASRLDATDKTNTVMFDDTTWPHGMAGTTLALTTVTFDTKTGEMLDADMELNTANFKLSTTDATPAGGYDFQSIVTHESGHFLGLAHSIDPTATMFASYTPGTQSLRTLAPDDVDGICTIYPPNGGCGCTTTPSPRDNTFAIAAAIVIFAARARRRKPLVPGVRLHARAELESMPTKQLLAQLQRLRACQQNIAASDFEPGDVPKGPERKAKRLARATALAFFPRSWSARQKKKGPATASRSHEP